MRSEITKCKKPSDPQFDLIGSELACNKFGDRYKCYLFNIDHTKCNYIGKEEGIDKISFIGELPNALIMIGKSSDEPNLPDIMVQGEITCNIFDDGKNIALACNKPL